MVDFRGICHFRSDFERFGRILKSIPAPVLWFPIAAKNNFHNKILNLNPHNETVPMILRGTDTQRMTAVTVNANNKKSEICGIHGLHFVQFVVYLYAGSWFTGIRRETSDLTQKQERKY